MSFSSNSTKSVKQLISEGLALHQRGLLDQAKVVYEEILVRQPRNFDALNFLGIVHAVSGQLDLAIDLFTKAVKINPSNANVLFNRANAFISSGNFSQALADLDKSLLIDPNNFNALLIQGNALKSSNRLQEAVNSYNKAIALQPDLAQAYSNRGVALSELKQFDEALGSFHQAIRFQPNLAEPYCNMGAVFTELKQFANAIECYNQAIAIEPNYADAFYNKANALKELKKLHEAIDNYKKAITINPSHIEAYFNCSNALNDINELEESLELYGKVIKYFGGYSKAYTNRGVIFQKLKQIDKAIDSYDCALHINSSDVEANWNKSLALLLTGKYLEGWKLYEWGWLNGERGEKRNFIQPLWLGDIPIKGKTILLYCEQGIGDTIQFCRFISFVKDLGAHVILEIPNQLLPLLLSYPSVDKLIIRGDPFPSFDYQCPLMSLPLALKIETSTIPFLSGYLTINQNNLMKWQRILGKKSKPRVGLVWSGNVNNRNDHNRSLHFSIIMKYLPSGFDFYCLQKELREEERELVAQSNISYYGNEIIDYSDTASLCKLMDLVISVDTSVAHLAGSLNIPTWILLPFSPDWRWMLNRDDSIWYDSVKLFRQEARGAWDSLLENLFSSLAVYFKLDKYN